MRIFSFVIAFLFFGVGITNATPWGMAKNATIDIDDGQLSFCLPTPDSKGVAIDSVWVTENKINNGGEQTVWDVEILPGATPVILNPNECLKYGAILPGYKENIPAKKLVAGVVYSFRLNRLLADARRTDVLFYTVVFCPVASNGDVRYLAYVVEESGRVVKPPCDGD